MRRSRIPGLRVRPHLLLRSELEMILRAVRPLALLLLALPLATPSRAQDEEPASYRRVSAREAVVRNLADDTGVEILRIPRGGLVRSRGEVSGWLSVEAPGGFPVWIFGRYLAGTDEPDVLEVTGNAVNLRPRPKSDVNSFPLPQRLHAGDRVRVIERLDAEGPLSETWVRVWSPEGVRAYVRAEDVEPLAAGEDGAALWAESLTQLPVDRAPARPATTRGEEAVAGGEAANPTSDVARARAQKSLETARDRLERERQADQPDFGAVREAIAEAQELDPSGSVALEAQFLLDKVAFYEEVRAVRSEIEARRALAQDAEADLRGDLEARVLAKDPLYDAFLSRGVLVRRLEVDGTPRFFLYFGGRTVSELVCSTGRYDLGVFSGYEVGVQGKALASPGEAAAGETPCIDVARLEVVKRR